MKLLLRSSSNDLFNSIHNSGRFEIEKITEVRPFDSNILVVDGNDVDIAVFTTTYAQNEVPTKTFYIMPAHMMQSNQEILQSDMPNVFFLAPRLTVNQITEQIILSSHDNVDLFERNIHVFYGADSKVGTTIIAQMNAEMIAEHTDQSVGLLLLGNNPVHYFENNGEVVGLDAVKMKLFNGLLTKEDLLKASLKNKKKNLTVIPGPATVQDKRYYQPEHAEKLLTLASKCFDVLIVDAGSDIERGLCIGAVRMAKSKFLVTTQQQNAKDEFLRNLDQVFTPLQIEARHFFCIVNKYVQGGIQKKQISGAYNMPVIGQVPYLDMQGWQAEIDHKSLLHYSQAGLNESIIETAEFICDVQSVPFHAAKQKRFFSRWIK